MDAAAPANRLRQLHELPLAARPAPVRPSAGDRARSLPSATGAVAQELGPYYTLRLGGEPTLVISGHEVVAAALRDRPEGFRRTPKMETVWRELGLPVGVFGANGEAWARQRRMVMAGFDPAHVRRYFRPCRRWRAAWPRAGEKAAAGGSAIDLQADLMRYTVDTLAGLAFGAEVNTLESDADVIQKHLDKLFPALYRRVLAPLPTWRWVKRARDRELEASIVEVTAAVDGFIAKARARMQAEPGPARADRRTCWKR